MLKVFVRRAAPWACAWMLGLPAAQAAEEGVPGVFARYQLWRDAPPQDWREANQRVGEIGGWRTYLRESQGEADPTRDEGEPAAQPHHGH